ncbi:MAG: hypothetical protein COB67_03150 [SAR324 cluster bacterium]|uniref:Probable membrane transporter protein n=1 Tax=SAR324 cluster bacterium TaxID=2024889 RepID=A0A2A4T8H1_9DELT|nr:MAG: hypothetical protein COB67_03150 [SAR324 cluster bacterium]
MSIELLALLFLVGLMAGFIDSIAGGGGLIALPALLSIGLPPQIALGTNKLQGTFGTFSATWNFLRKGEISLSEVWRGVIFTLIGAGIGAWSIQQIDAGFLQQIIPFLLLGVFLHTLLSKDLGFKERPARLESPIFFFIFGLLLGFYDGFFGPGTGSFWTAAILLLLGLNMTKATGITKVMNFSSNVIALILFIQGGNVVYSVGLSMGAGQLIGARIGSGLAIKKGAAFIRPVFLSVVFVTILRLAYVNYQGS